MTWSVDVSPRPQVKEHEARLISGLAAGSPLSSGTNLDEHVAALRRGEASSLRFL